MTTIDRNLMRIISKIVKPPAITTTKDREQLYSRIHNIINYKKTKDADKLVRIDAALIQAGGPKQPPPENRQSFIFEKVGAYLNKAHYISPATRILDIGGGNGNFLSYLGEQYGIPRDNLVVLEPTRHALGGDAFQYLFDNENVQYSFWDEPETMRDIGQFDLVICMVVLHHITDEKIRANIMPFIVGHMSPGGYLLIKEHDCRSAITANLINWEHHLYYLLEQPHKVGLSAIDQYLADFVANYKSSEYFTGMLADFGFKLKKTFSNIFDVVAPGFRNDAPTRLYWALYQLGGAPSR